MKTSFHAMRRGRLLVRIAAAVAAAGCGSSTTSSPSTASSTGAKSSSQAGGRSYDLPSTVQALKIESEAATVQVTASQGSSQNPCGGAVHWQRQLQPQRSWILGHDRIPLPRRDQLQ